MNDELEILDFALALAGVEGDAQSLADLAGLAEAAWPSLLHNIREALTCGDLRAMECAARLVRVTTQNLFAGRACAAASLLEAMAGCGEVVGLRPAISRLEDELNQLKPALDAIRRAAESWMNGGVEKP